MKIGKKLLSFLLTAAIFLTVLPGSVLAAGNAAGGKLIHVVYDDSRSMYLNGETRWCQAKYAMEVFCAMMGEQDIMNIYAMNRPDILTIYGSDAARVEKVHAMTSTYDGTPFDTVTQAGDALMAADPSVERWLVVLTDGAFDQTSKSTVQNTLDGYNDAGIKTVYLAIGNTAVELRGDSARGAYAEKAATTGDILAKVTSIANQIFEHQVLGDKFMQNAGTEVLLNIDIPTEQIVVFAQGEGAAIGALQLNGRTIEADSVQSVRHSGDVMPLNDEEIPVDTSLYGIVATFEAGAKPFESGQFAVQVSNARTVEYYYRPGVEVNCELLYRGSAVQTHEELYAGDYEVALSFVDPLTGKTIESELLSAARFTLTVMNNGTKQVVPDKTGHVQLEVGDVSIRAAAELPGNVFLENSKNYVVVPKPIDLTLTFEPNGGTYSPDRMGSGAQPILLRAVDAESGRALTGEEWELAEVTLADVDGVDWEVIMGSEVGTWEIRPIAAEKSIADVPAGSYEVNTAVSYKLGEQNAFGTGSFPLHVEAYAGNALQVEIGPPEGTYDLNDNGMENPAGMLVTVLYEDPQSGNFLPLTNEMWNSFELTASSDKRMAWNLEKGTAVGTWKLTPGYYAGDPVMTEGGAVHVEVSAEGSTGDYTYAGSGSRDLEVTPLSRENLMRMIIPRIALSIFLLWLIIGYIKKKRLRLRGLNPRCNYKGTNTPKLRISKDFFSVILPYVPEKATVYCHKAAFRCEFPNLRIQATGRRSFKIINRTMPLNRTKICGEFYSDMETLRSRNFSFGSFDISSVDPHANNRKLGIFTFN